MTPHRPDRPDRAHAPYVERRLALAVFVAGIAITAITVMVLAMTAADRDRQVFQASAANAQDAVIDRVGTSIALLRGAAGLFASHESAVTAAAFRAYMARLALPEQYAGLLGIGFSLRVAPEEVKSLEAEMRGQGHDAFRVWPDYARDEFHAIVFLEPLHQRNRAAIGYDMYTNGTRQAAMARARDTGRVAASGIVELVQEIDERKQPGFLIYLPVYQGGLIPATLEERRGRLLGFAYSPIRAGDFLSAAFAHQTVPDLNLSIYHGTSAQPSALLYEYASRPDGASRFTQTTTVEVAGEPWTFEFRSHTMWIHALVMPLLAAFAGIAFSWLLAVLVARETRARADVQHALDRERSARADAERANAMKDQFLATLSHELRTPISAIVGWTTILKRAGVEDRRLRDAVDVIDRNARAQVRLIDDLLDMNGIMSGKLSLDMQALDLAAVVADAVSVVIPNADAKRVMIEQRKDSGPVGVHGDSARLQQVAWNLLNNAIKFTPSGGRVTVTLKRVADRSQLIVTDTGEGIEPESLERIFDRFAQADGSITRRHGGLGLGLAIVRHLAEMHGGTVRADSRGKGYGATFTVELPAAALPAAAIGRSAADARDHHALHGIKILVVDDEPDAREFLRVLLEERKATVRCAASAQDALALFRTLQPDVLISDIGMPGMDGYELIRKIRAAMTTRTRLLAIAVTAYARGEDRAEALRAGFDMHLVKPVKPEQLVTHISGFALSEAGSA